jgi:chemotaxis protein MotB
MEKGAQQPIIIVKKKGHGHGHHGGGWKVALADFMTAMMAFFLLMWLLGSTNKEEKRAISGYFNDPTSQFMIGEGGANSAIVDASQPQTTPPTSDPLGEPTVKPENDKESTQDNTEPSTAAEIAAATLKKESEDNEKAQIVSLQEQLQMQINDESVFQEIKDQILLDFTAEGLRIQIVDKEQRPMFDSGSAHLKPYSDAVLKALVPILSKVNNKISVTGYTDATPYGTNSTYTNWELSADRANSARRALQEGGYPDDKIAAVQGLGSSSPFLIDKPAEAINRRIAIVVLKKAVSDALSNGSKGINSNDFIHSPTAAPHVMTPQEVDTATDTL